MAYQDDNSPFNDPAVQKATASVLTSAAQNPEVRNAMMNAAVSSYSQPAPPPKPSSGTDSAYNDGGWDQENQQNSGALPEEKSCWNEMKERLGYCSARLPLRYLLILTGVSFIIAGITDFAFDFDSALDIFVNIYLIIFGFMVIIIEAPRLARTAAFQDKVFYWAMFLSRLWGRAWFYFFLAILCLSDGKSSTPKIIVAVFVIFVAGVMFFVGYSSAAKVKRFEVFISQGCEAEQRLERIRQKFRELDNVSNNYLTDDHLFLLAEQADRELSTSEANTIMRFFNKSMDNQISLGEWEEGFAVITQGVRSL